MDLVILLYVLIIGIGDLLDIFVIFYIEVGGDVSEVVGYRVMDVLLKFVVVYSGVSMVLWLV